MIDVIPQCVYDENNPSDVAEFSGDDPYDCLRYVLRSVEHYVQDSRSKFEELQQVEAVEQKLESTQDYTTFYRQMEQI
jgi:hypothetical protein